MVTCGRTWRRRNKRKQLNYPHILLDQEYIQFLKWAKQNGVNFRSVRPAIFHDTGRGMIATRKITEGESIISVPRQLLITTSTALKSNVGRLLERMSQWANVKLSRKCILCLYVAYLKYLGDKSFWYPYIATLPKEFNTPCYFSDNELRTLPESSYEQCLAQISEVQQAFNMIKETYNNEFPNDHFDFLKLLTFEDFKWTWFVVNTRSVYLASDEEKCSGCYGDCCHGDGYALAPVLDLLNHQDTAEISAGFNQESQAYTIRTITEYQRYNQVFINYGPHDNTTLLIEYGFILPKNIHNAFKFKPEQIFLILNLPSTPTLTKKMNLIKRNNFKQDFSCTEDDGISWSLLAALRILALEENMLSQWNKVLDGKPVSISSEILVQQWIAQILSHSLEIIETKHLEQHGQSTNTQLALQLRQQEIQILTAVLYRVDIPRVVAENGPIIKSTVSDRVRQFRL